MAILLKPRSNSQGVVDTTADLAQLNGRPGYQVLVKDNGLFEWLSTGVVDNDNIYPGLSGVWSKVLMSGDITLAFTAEDSANKSLNIITDAASDVKYPSVKATKTYADSLVTGLLDDRGNFTPSLTSPGAWPTTGGSGTAGAIMKGDIWFCSASGFMGTTAVVAGSSFRAVVDTPGQTDANWNVLSAGAISTTTPSLSQVTAVGATTATGMAVINNLSVSGISISSTGGNGGAEIGYEATINGFVSIDNGTNAGFISANNLTNTRYFELPDAGGTLALTSDVGLPYKVWVANLTQSGTNAPTATVLQNTLGGNITLARIGTGYYTLTLSSAFTAGKTVIFTKGIANTPTNPKDVTVTRTGSNTIDVYTGGAGVSEDDILNVYSVEIRVYP